MTLTRFDRLMVEDLPDQVRNYEATRLVVEEGEPENLLPLAELKRRYICRVLRALDGNKSQAARVLGLDRRTLYRQLEREAEPAAPQD